MSIKKVRCRGGRCARAMAMMTNKIIFIIHDAPESYKCPIGRLIMRDPVELSDGHSYEKRKIKQWLKQQQQQQQQHIPSGSHTV